MSMVHVTDRLFDAMADEQRRRILFDLAERGPEDESPINIDAPPDAVGSDETASIERQHVHLPKLDEYGFVDWEPGSNVVTAGNRFEEIASTLELLRENR